VRSTTGVLEGMRQTQGRLIFAYVVRDLEARFERFSAAYKLVTHQIFFEPLARLLSAAKYVFDLSLDALWALIESGECFLRS
jgi:hypothetical protein